MIDKKLEVYYEERFSMLGTQGWKDLIEDVDGMIESTDRIGAITTVEQLNFRKGELSILHWIKSLRDMSESAYKELNGETTE